MQKVYMLSTDNGDGSNSTHFFAKEPNLNAMTEEDPETYGCNEGNMDVLTFPDDLDLHACGFRFSDDD